jgi:topoisomerase-4 subunit A
MAYVNKLFNDNFLEYASYVIKDRAIPHIDDGFKPVQRRIMHSLLEKDDGKFHKVANVVGHCMQYHPHGDASIFSALVVLANKDLFIEKQGNFGNILTGDEASAARYIECRALPFAKEVLYHPALTQYEDSYDGRRKEPVVFPAKIPVILIQGAEGIAVGMATKILPHNLVEVLEAVQADLRGEKFELFPDFPSGGIIDASGYEDGRGRVLVRAKLDTKDPKKIVIRELPFGVTTEGIINSIESAAKRGKIKISNINDFTTEDVEIEIGLARGVYSQETVDALFAFTDCEVSIPVNLLIIKDNLPTSMTVTEVIKYHSKKLVSILEAELKLEQKNLKDKLHARTLERIFIEERIYKDIEDKDSADKVNKAVKDGFIPFKKELMRAVSDEDVERLLKIPIRRISLYDINKAKKEMDEIKARLKVIKKHLSDVVKYAIDYVTGILEREGGRFERRSELSSFQKVDVREAASRNLNLRYDSERGYLGYNVSSGKQLFAVSEYDRVLVIKKDGSYSVIQAPEKLFIDKGMRACLLAEKKILEGHTFTLVFELTDNKSVYIKRCKIEKFITDKVYELVPKGGRILSLTVKEKGSINLKYKKKPGLRVLEEEFRIEDYLVKGVSAGGVRLSTKQIQSLRIST